MYFVKSESLREESIAVRSDRDFFVIFLSVASGFRFPSHPEIFFGGLAVLLVYLQQRLWLFLAKWIASMSSGSSKS